MSDTTNETAKHIRAIARVAGMPFETALGKGFLIGGLFTNVERIVSPKEPTLEPLLAFVAYAEAEAARRGVHLFFIRAAGYDHGVYYGAPSEHWTSAQAVCDFTDPHSTARAKLAALAEAFEWWETNK